MSIKETEGEEEIDRLMRVIKRQAGGVSRLLAELQKLNKALSQTRNDGKQILIVGNQNGGRSHMVQAFLSDHCGKAFEVYSAGLKAGSLCPWAVEVMREIGFDISQKPTMLVTDLAKAGQRFAHVITVGDKAVAERCPTLVAGMRIHWELEDPAKFHGTHRDKLARTRRLRDEIRAKIKKWCGEYCQALRRPLPATATEPSKNWPTEIVQQEYRLRDFRLDQGFSP